jgi:hypothetical protein
MLAAHIISIVFRLINFGALVGAALYFFKKSGKAAIEHIETEKKAYLGGLHEQKRALDYQKEQITQEVAQQELLIALLKERVMHWQQRVMQEREMFEHYKILQEQSMQERTQKRKEGIAKQQLYAQVMPQAIKQAQKKLTDQYTLSQEADQFMNRIFDHLKKEIS